MVKKSLRKSENMIISKQRSNRAITYKFSMIKYHIFIIQNVYTYSVPHYEQFILYYFLQYLLSQFFVKGTHFQELLFLHKMWNSKLMNPTVIYTQFSLAVYYCPSALKSICLGLNWLLQQLHNSPTSKPMEKN